MQCAANTALNQHLHMLEQQETAQTQLDSMIDKIATDLLNCRKVEIKGEQWNFDDVLTEMFERPEFNEICYMLRLAGDDDTHLRSANEAYQTLMNECALYIATSLAPDALRQKKRLAA